MRPKALTLELVKFLVVVALRRNTLRICYSERHTGTGGLVVAIRRGHHI
jgi:hypothetical protein